MRSAPASVLKPGNVAFMDFVGFITNNIITFIVIMTLLVFVHEWGHYWIGVRNGIKAEVFSVGFGRERLFLPQPGTDIFHDPCDIQKTDLRRKKSTNRYLIGSIHNCR